MKQLRVMHINIEVDVVLNPIPAKKLSKELMECVTYLIVNEQAAKSMTGIKIHSDWKREWTRFNLDEARVASAVIRGRGVPTVLITLAEKGVIMNTPERFTIRSDRNVEWSIQEQQEMHLSGHSVQGSVRMILLEKY